MEEVDQFAELSNLERIIIGKGYFTKSCYPEKVTLVDLEEL